jgi:hypothetical protein
MRERRTNRFLNSVQNRVGAKLIWSSTVVLSLQNEFAASPTAQYSSEVLLATFPVDDTHSFHLDRN